MRGGAILSEFGSRAKKSDAEMPPARHRGRKYVALQIVLLMAGVVLVAVNLARRSVLLAVDLGALLGG